MDYTVSYEEFKDMYKHRERRNINRKFLYKVGKNLKKKHLPRNRREKVNRMMQQLSYEINRHTRFGEENDQSENESENETEDDNSENSNSFGQSTGILVSNKPY